MKFLDHNYFFNFLKHEIKFKKLFFFKRTYLTNSPFMSWFNLWVETDYLYLVHLFNSGTSKNSWRIRSQWLRAVMLAKKKGI